MPPSPAPHPQKQNLVVYTKLWTHRDLGEQTAQAWCYGLICNNSDYNSNALPWLTELF